MSTLLEKVVLTPEEERKKYRNQKIATKFASIGYKIFRFALLFGLCFVLLYPLLYMISMSFRPLDQIYDPAVIWIPKSLTLQNFKDVMDPLAMDYWNSLKTSLLVNVVSSLMQVLATCFVGYGLARFKFRGKGLMFALVVFSAIVPPQLTIIPMYLQYKSFDPLGIFTLITGAPINLLDSVWTFFLPAILGVGLNASLFIFIFRQFFAGLPKELEDSAAIDGCGFFKTFIRIMIPNAGSVFLTAIILSIVWYWNDYNLGMMFFTNHKTVMTALVELEAGLFKIDQSFDPYRHYTRMQAGSLLAIAPVVLMYIVLQKYFISGVERSGIVG